MKIILRLFSILTINYCLLQLSFAQDKTAIAVFNLESRGISNTEALIITDRLRSELIKTDKFNIMERNLMEEILKEQAIQLTGICSETSCLVEVGRIIAVQQMVGGSIGRIGNLFTMQVRIVDVETGEVIKSVEEDYQGSIEMVLTTITKKIARRLADLSIEEELFTGKGNCDLYLESDPMGALIYIDNQPTGKTTPATITGLFTGEHIVTLRKENLGTRFSLNLADGELKRERKLLQRLKNNIRVLSTPAGARVLGNEFIGITPVNFELDHSIPSANITLVKEGYTNEEIKLDFDDKLDYRIQKNLRLAGSIYIGSRPVGAEVIIDGKTVGRTPFRSKKIGYGKHELKLSLNNYEAISKNFVVDKSNHSHNFNITLEQKLTDIEINGYPAGAYISIDGNEAGKIPLKKYTIPFGRHTIQLDKAGYYQLNKNINISGETGKIQNLILQPKSKALATLYSSIVPGMGQVYSGNPTRGYIVGLVTLGSATATILTYQAYKENKEKYLDDKNAYENNTDLTTMNSLKSAMNSSHDQMKKNYDLSRVFIIASSVLWVYNIVDAYLFFPEIEEFSISMDTKNQQSKISFTVNF